MPAMSSESIGQVEDGRRTRTESPSVVALQTVSHNHHRVVFPSSFTQQALSLPPPSSGPFLP